MMLTLQYKPYFPDTTPISPKTPCSPVKKSNIKKNNLQPSQLLNRPLPSLPYSSDVQQLLKKFKFQYSDVTDDEYSKLCAILVKYQHCYATHRDDGDKIPTLFRIRLKPNAKLQTQRPIKVRTQYKEKLMKLLVELEKHKNIR